MQNSIFYFQSNDSLKIKQDIIDFLRRRLRRNPVRVRDIDSDKLMQQETEKLMRSIIIDYHHPLFIVQDNKLQVFDHSILDNVFSKAELEERLKSLQGRIMDEEDHELNVKDLKDVIFEDARHFNFDILQSKRPNFEQSYQDQFFYISNRIAVKIAVSTQRFLYNLSNKYPNHIVNLNQFISNNLLTEWIMTFIPQSLMLFGEIKANQQAPILFEINQLWGGINTPLLATNFITQNVPNKWLFLSTQNLLDANFNFETILRKSAEYYYINKKNANSSKNDKNKQNSNEIENAYQFYFLQRNEIPELVENNKIIPYIQKNTTMSYSNSTLSAFVNGRHKYFFEIAKLEDLQSSTY